MTGCIMYGIVAAAGLQAAAARAMVLAVVGPHVDAEGEVNSGSAFFAHLP